MLTCEKHTAEIWDRGGKQKIGSLDPLVRVRWERIRDDISLGRVEAHAVSAECSKVLGLTEAGRHELVIFRGKKRVWEGPITRVTYTKTSVEIEARDVVHYANRTIMRNEYDNRYPNNVKVLDRLARIFRAEMSRKEALDPPANVLNHVKYIYAGDDKTWLNRYYDTATISRQVRASVSIGELNAYLNDMQRTYGFRVDLGVAGPSFGEYGIDWTAPTITSTNLKDSVVAGIQALGQYPPEFVRSLGLAGFYFVEDLVIHDLPGWNVGGVAVDGLQFVDIADHGSGGVSGSDYITHHEFSHLQWDAFPETIPGLAEQWNALNPVGFQYSGMDYQNPPYTDHPTGFIRDYGRHSMKEDFAEIAAAVFTTNFQPRLTTLMQNDSIINQKVALYKEWMADVSGGLIAGANYYKGIHKGKFVEVGASGVRDAGTAAWTLPYEMTVFDHMDEYAARGGIDYTTIGRSIIFFDVAKRIGQTPMVTESDFIGSPIITQYGMELATRVVMTDGKGNYGAAGGVDPYYGEWEVLHQAYDEEAEQEGAEPPSVKEMTSQAKRTYAQGKVPPMVLRLPDNTRINPDGVLTLDDLVPGIWIPLQAELPGRKLSQMQKLDSMSVEEVGGTGETINITMSPAVTDIDYFEED